MSSTPPKSPSKKTSEWDLAPILAASAPILRDKKIILGVTGGIAIYKSIELCRLLTKAGARVKVVMTQGALAFIQPLTFQAVTGHEPHIELLDSSSEAGMGHIELARWADLLFISPCSANTLAKLAHGFAPDLLTTLALATPAPVAVAPAMNQQMWCHPAVKRNIKLLLADGIKIIKPAEGVQACGDNGPGRAQEPLFLLGAIEMMFQSNLLQDLKILITAGPTREAIDPVRFISNHSSGLMGYALARAAALAGARVTLISGPSQCPWPHNVQGQKVESADAMLAACQEKNDYDVIIGAAAVGDFKPAHSATHKLGKQELKNQIKLSENPDIISALGALNPKAIRIGFAAQTHDLQALAAKKMKKKGLSLICANDVSDHNIGFNAAKNTITLLAESKKTPLTLGPMPKETLAQSIMAALHQLFIV